LQEQSKLDLLTSDFQYRRQSRNGKQVFCLIWCDKPEYQRCMHDASDLLNQT